MLLTSPLNSMLALLLSLLARSRYYDQPSNHLQRAFSLKEEQVVRQIGLLIAGARVGAEEGSSRWGGGFAEGKGGGSKQRRGDSFLVTHSLGPPSFSFPCPFLFSSRYRLLPTPPRSCPSSMLPSHFCHRRWPLLSPPAFVFPTNVGRLLQCYRRFQNTQTGPASSLLGMACVRDTNTDSDQLHGQ